jgi:Domain of unknown function (DUF1929)
MLYSSRATFQNPLVRSVRSWLTHLVTCIVMTGLLFACAGPNPESAGPTQFKATASAGVIALQWNASGVSKYMLERRLNTGAFIPIASTRQSSFMDADVQGNRAYVYRLTASEAASKPLESELVFSVLEPLSGEVILKPAVLNPVKTGDTARLEALVGGPQTVAWSVSSGAGTLATNGRQASFVSSVPGSYALKATNAQTPSRSAQTVVRVLTQEQANLLALVGPTFTYVDATATLRLSVGGKEFTEEVTWNISPAGPVVVRNQNTYMFVSKTPGSYTISASSKAAAGGTSISSESLTLEVRNSEVTKLGLSASPTSLELGDVITLEPSITGNGDFNRSLTWQISPAAVAGSTSGAVQNLPIRNLPPRNNTYRFVPSTAGTYSITAISASNPNQTATVAVQVRAPTQTVTPSGLGRWGAKFDWPQRNLDDKRGIVPIHAALMPSGKVMTFGWTPGDGRSQYTDGAVWNPITGAFQTLRNPTSNIFCAGTAMLIDGRLFVAGGLVQAVTEKGIPDLNVFDGAAFEAAIAAKPQEFSGGGWTRLNNMPEARYYPSALTLGNGDVFISGGTKADESVNQSSDLWKPNGEVVPLPGTSRVGKRFYPMLFQASDGSVFDLGPRSDIYALDPKGSGSARFIFDRDTIFRDYASAVMYRPGKVIVMGGGGAEDDGPAPTASTKIFNLNNPEDVIMTDGANMIAPRRQHNAVLLPNGQVLVIGGTSGVGFNNGAAGLLASEVWDPVNGTFKTLASMSIKRMYHSIAILLPDGRVLAAGGGRGIEDAPDEPNGEVFSPPYLFNNDGSPAVRPVILNVPTKLTYGTEFSVLTDTQTISRATMVRLSSVTHSTNFDQRFIELPILSRDGAAVNVTVNTSRLVTQPGYYMLFVLNAQGIPSVSKIVQLQ